MQQHTTSIPTAVVEPGAQLGAGVVIGPFCHVGAEAVIGDGVELVSHVSIMAPPRSAKTARSIRRPCLARRRRTPSTRAAARRWSIGRNCTIREGVTMHTGTDTSRGETIVGDNGNFLAYSPRRP